MTGNGGENRRTIRKYQIPIAPRFTLRMPLGARVLSVQRHKGVVLMYALVVPAAPETDHYFALLAVGHDADPFDGGQYLCSFQDRDVVWHLFRDEEESALV